MINYNLGKDMVAAHVEARGGTPDNPAKRWEEFATADFVATAAVWPERRSR